MYLENVVFDATDPRALGRFWEAALGTEELTDSPEGYETRLAVPDGPVLDLCFQPVPERPGERQRLHLDLLGGEDQQAVVERLLDLGATSRNIEGQVPWVMLADPEGNGFCVREERKGYVDTGPLAALPLEVADPARERDFWSWLTGWVPVEGAGPGVLRHPSHRGPLLELCPEDAAKGTTKNRTHLDVRLEPGDDADALARQIAERGGRELHPDWGDLPWRVFTDPSGNELCMLPAPG